MLKKLHEIPAKFTNAPDAFAISITGDGTLILRDEKKSLSFHDFLICADKHWFAGSGFHRMSSIEDIPDEGINIGIKTPKKLLLFKDRGSVEFISKKYPATQETHFLLWLLLPNAVELSFVAGDISPSYHSILLPKTDEMIDFSKALAMLIIGSWNTQAGEKISALEDSTDA